MRVITFIYIFLISSFFLANTPIFAQPGLGIPFEKDFHRIDGETKFAAVGILRCEDRSHEKGLPCNLKFVRSLDNTEFKIEANPQLLAMHCDDHRDVKLYISGKYTVRTVLGNDRIEVKSFRKMKKLDENEVQAFLSMTKNSNNEINGLYHASFNIGL